MFKDSIPGLDKLFRTDITAPKVVLVSGPPGSMKTSFCYAIMSSYLKKNNQFGIYITLEETASSHDRNMKALGIDPGNNMQIADFTDLRDLDKGLGSVVEEEEASNYVEYIDQTIDHFKKKHGDRFSVVAIDSLGALYSLMNENTNVRKKMFYFFKRLREQNLIAFIIMERAPGAQSDLLGNEGFLVDGIIEVGLDRSDGKLSRFVRVEKMRAVQHSMEKHIMDVSAAKGMVVLGPSLG